MFEYLEGRLIEKTATSAVIDCGGVGYRLHISLETSAALPSSGPVKLLVHPYYSESDQRLYGFATTAERELYRLLQGVRGVGPSVAMAILSHEPPERLIARLQAGDLTGLTRIKGIGKKTAERLLLELKDALASLGAGAATAAPPMEDTLARALENLGLGAAEARQRSRTVVRDHPDEHRVEELLRRALRRDGPDAGHRTAAP